jgi:2-polyprenyl-3-methyl-5-hydroxy-6-metoxy-1,4-benzoquinol methylase
MAKTLPERALYARWDDLWKNYRLTFVGRWMFAAKIRKLVSVLRRLRPADVLDVGCGLGHILRAVLKTGTRARGIDVSKTAVRECRKAGLPVSEGRLEDERKKYDLVMSDGLLEHFADFRPYARHMARISRRHVLIVQSDHDSPVMKVLFVLERLLGRNNIPELDHRIADFIRVFRGLGMTCVLNEGLFFNGYRVLVFGRR